MTTHAEKELIAFSIPTGIGASIGGYAGDCGHIARRFSEHFKLVVNPNVVNAGTLSAINDEMLYVEGYVFDKLLCGGLELSPVLKNKIGVIFDKDIPQNILNIHINTINAAKVVWGLDILGYEMTKTSVGVEFSVEKGVSSGSLKNPLTLLEAAKTLVEKGAEALAVVCFFKDEKGGEGETCENENYSSGIGVDPIGGVEAIISHYLVKELNIPAAHSPAFSTPDIAEVVVSEKASSEYISSTYLPCVLQGLSGAPQFGAQGEISYKNIKALVLPAGALGSKAVLGCVKNKILICAVKNPCEIDVTCQKLARYDTISDITKGIKEFDNYDSCLDFLRNKFYGYEKI